jgi:hypothetical protein
MRIFAALLSVVAVFSVAVADELKSGPDKCLPFNVKAITGDKKGKELCYYCAYSGEKRPAVVVVFTQKADENLATLVKSIDEVQKNNAKLGTFVVGTSGVAAADLEKLQETHKLTTPLTIASDKDGPEKYNLNKEATVTVLVYKQGGAVQKSFAFKSTKEAAAAASEVSKAATAALGN